MPLPPPGNNVTWRDYRISTPTFRLTPIEKADMSPFLIHMTGKHQLASILRGEGVPNGMAVPPEHGYLRASVPEDGNGAFAVPVVCFTESPTFTLDFFRYRSYRRWQRDLRFGIGFEKEALIGLGTRPVFYAEDESIRALIHLYHQYVETGRSLSEDDQLNETLVDFIGRVVPLLYPLLERHEAQGFMWEREWRFREPAGLVFAHSIIRVICCPPEEEQSVRDALGDTAAFIRFVHTWREYDDVTDYLKRQEPLWQAEVNRYRQARCDRPGQDAVGALEAAIQSYRVTVNSLDSYEDYMRYLAQELEKTVEQRADLQRTISELEAERDTLRAELDREREAEEEDIVFADLPAGPDDEYTF